VWHPENASRLQAVMESVENLKNEYPQHVEVEKNSFTAATVELIHSVHAIKYVEKIMSIIPASESEDPEHATDYSDDDRSSDDGDTFVSHGSFQAALYAVGAVCEGVDKVMSNTIHSVFCAVRPPGHHVGKCGHTETAPSQGFCIVNNVAIGAMYCKTKYNLQRIAVVDFDVHHGNGTEELLGGVENFLFISIHVDDLYPRTGFAGENRTPNVVNVPLRPHTKAATFQKAFVEIVIPALDSYKPEILILSAGFDGYKEDFTDALHLDPSDFFDITVMLKGVADKHCGGKIVSVLEGGYHLVGLKKCVRAHLLALLNVSNCDV